MRTVIQGRNFYIETLQTSAERFTTFAVNEGGIRIPKAVHDSMWQAEMFHRGYAASLEDHYKSKAYANSAAGKQEAAAKAKEKEQKKFRRMLDL